MLKIKHLIIILISLILLSCSSKGDTLSVMQFNIWQEGTSVENGFEGIVDNIINVNPDMVTFSEVRNYNNTDFIGRLVDALSQKGYFYNGRSSTSTGLISKYPITEQTVIYPLKNDAGSITKASIDVNGKTVALYSAHLDYRHYACYLPRGYDGSTWEKMEAPITDVDSILSQNRKSFRQRQLMLLLKNQKRR